MSGYVNVTDIQGGRPLDDGSGAWIVADTEQGQLRVIFSLQALEKAPLLLLDLLARAKAKDQSASYFSIKIVEARIGEDRTSPDALIFLLLPGTQTRLAFEIPPGGLDQLKTDIEAIEHRRSIPAQGRPDN